jgi:hypothetical protein
MRDFEIGELREAGAADDAEHVCPCPIRLDAQPIRFVLLCETLRICV